MPYPQFDRSRLRIRPLAERQHDITHERLLSLDELPPPLEPPAMEALAAVFVADFGAGAQRVTTAELQEQLDAFVGDDCD